MFVSGFMVVVWVCGCVLCGIFALHCFNMWVVL